MFKHTELFKVGESVFLAKKLFQKKNKGKQQIFIFKFFFLNSYLIEKKNEI